MKSRLLLVLVVLSLLVVSTHGASLLARVRMDSVTRPGFESYLLGKTMPVSTEPNIVVRSMVEEMFVKYLNKNKVDAIEANKIISTDRSYTDEEIKEQVLNNGIKSVLIIKFAGTTETTTQLPSTITGTGNVFYLNPGATITHQILMFEITPLVEISTYSRQNSAFKTLSPFSLQPVKKS